MKKICILSLCIISALGFCGCTASAPVLQPKTQLKAAALKGPTGMGLVKLMEDAGTGQALNDYEFTISGTADELSAGLIKGELDIAAIPCNLASVLYNKTEGKIKTVAINNLGVLYVVEKGNSIQSIADLRGKTIYTTGKGTTPEYSLAHILRANGLDPGKDVAVEFKSEATEVAALFKSGQITVAMLPQPYVTTVINTDPDIRVALDMNGEWEKLNGGNAGMVTGVVVVRADTLEKEPEAVNRFLEDYRQSVGFILADTEGGAVLVEKYGIASAAVAKQAIPACNLVLIEGDEMQNAMEEYLQILFEANPASVGGKLPDENFYYKK